MNRELRVRNTFSMRNGLRGSSRSQLVCHACQRCSALGASTESSGRMVS